MFGQYICCLEVYRRFRPWYRHDSHGFAEGRRCMLCVNFADKGFKSRGGRSFLKTLAGATKASFRADLKTFINNLSEGKVLQGEVSLGTSVSLSKDRSLCVEVAWDFATKEFLETHEPDFDKDNLVCFENQGTTYEGVWRKAQLLMPPDGCIRVIERASTTATMKNDLDHSSGIVRENQLEDAFADAQKFVDRGARKAEQPLEEPPNKKKPTLQRQNAQVFEVEDERRPFVSKCMSLPSQSSYASPSKASGGPQISPRQQQSGGMDTTPSCKRKLGAIVSLPPSKRKRFVATVESQLEGWERLEKGIMSSEAENQVKIATLLGMHKKLVKSAETMSGIDITNDEDDDITLAANKLRSAVVKLEASLKVARAMHPEDEQISSSAHLSFAISQFQGAVLGVPRSFLLALFKTIVSEALHDNVDFNNAVAVLDLKKKDGEVNFSCLVSGLDEEDIANAQAGCVRDGLALILQLPTVDADRPIGVDELKFLKALRTIDLKQPVKEIADALHDLLCFDASVASPDLAKSHKTMMEDQKLMKLLSHGSKRGPLLLQRVSDRMASCLEDDCHKKTMDALQKQLAENPDVCNIMVWSEVHNQRARIDAVTSSSFKEVHEVVLKNVDEKLEAARVTIVNSAPHRARAMGKHIHMTTYTSTMFLIELLTIVMCGTCF